jgi:hypothetical protein
MIGNQADNRVNKMTKCLLITSMVAALVALAMQPASAQRETGVSCGFSCIRPHGGGPYRAINISPTTGRPYSAEALPSPAKPAYPARSNSATQAQPPKIGHCDLLCQRKCQATWQRGNLPSVEACYTKWSRLNAMGIARQCEAANRARLAGQPRLPGC